MYLRAVSLMSLTYNLIMWENITAGVPREEQERAQEMRNRTG